LHKSLHRGWLRHAFNAFVAQVIKTRNMSVSGVLMESYSTIDCGSRLSWSQLTL